MRCHPFGLRFAWMIVIAGVFTLPGCAKKPSGGLAAPPRGQPPTDEEARQFAKSFAASVKAGDLAAVNAAFDWDAIVDRAAANCEISEATRKQFLKDVKADTAGPHGLPSEIIATVQKGGTYRLLRIHQQSGQKWALFRLLFGGQAANYQDLVLARQADGKVRAVDAYIYAQGELTSETLHRDLLLAGPTGQEGDDLRNLANVEALARCVQNGEAAKAMEAYAHLPDSLKVQKNILLLRLRASVLLGSKEKETAIRDFRAAFPHDPALDFLLIDVYCLHKQYAKARASIDRFDRLVGGDPYLNLVRASTYLAENQYKTARQYAEKAIAAESDLVYAYFSLIAISLAEKDFDETSRLLTAIREKFPEKMPDMRRIPAYAEYLKSPQYEAWLKTLKK
ncbi:MAG: tetratricopeptide repeat protein [Thermoguttaceae bacterium]